MSGSARWQCSLHEGGGQIPGLKWGAWSLVLVLCSQTALGQGTVNFSNLGAHPITMADGTPVSSPEFQAGLFYAEDGVTDESQFVLVGATAVFLAPGVIVGGTRTAPVTPPGATVNMQVRVWPSEFATYAEAAQTQGVQVGASKILSVRTSWGEAWGGPPASLVEAGLAPFSLRRVDGITLETVEWIVAVGVWHDAAGWSGHVPGATNEAKVDNGGTVFFDQGVMRCARLGIGDTFSGNIEQIGGQVLVEYGLRIGQDGIGSFNQAGGIVEAEWLVLGSKSGGQGAYWLRDGFLTAGLEELGGDGSGWMEQSGGTNIAGSLVISSEGYELIGGWLIAEWETLGRNSHFVQSGGTHFVTGQMGLYGGSNEIAGGFLGVNDLFATGAYVTGTPAFNIRGADAEIVVTNTINLGRFWAAVPGSTLRCLGNSVTLGTSSNSALRLVLEGRHEDPTRFYGPMAGVARLTIGDELAADAVIARDVVVAELVVRSGSSIDLGESALNVGRNGYESSGVLENNGVVRFHSRPGTSGLTGLYSQHEDGELAMRLGTNSHDRLVVSGGAGLDGKLSIESAEGRRLRPGDTFVLIEHGGSSGAFEEVAFPDAAPLGYQIQYQAGAVVLLVTGMTMEFRDGGVSISITGEAGGNYVLEESSNLKEWVPILQFTGVAEFTDLDAASHVSRFYRYGLLP